MCGKKRVEVQGQFYSEDTGDKEVGRVCGNLSCEMSVGTYGHPPHSTNHRCSVCSYEFEDPGL